jgi:hypothetical protein
VACAFLSAPTLAELVDVSGGEEQFGLYAKL